MIAHSRLRFTLPGEWWHAPIDGDAEARAVEIANFVREQYGRRDDLAQLRADHRLRLARALEAAIARGATQYHVSLANDGGVAFASTLSEYALPPTFGEDSTPAVLVEKLVAALRPPEVDAEPWQAFESGGGVAFAKGDSIVLRRITRRAADASDESSAESLTADYWITVPGAAEVVLASLSTVLLQLEPLMLELFDRIIEAAEWADAQPATRTIRDELAESADPV
ncbi:hypothetical protein [Agromyces subbeticus]|uniref:hypothetical protein n=1 Tax=Agromyces subbeticus TaxID=293890 RepID=UPI0003B65C15|nr:hypothetical protein [Agromyces subbeticus]